MPYGTRVAMTCLLCGKSADGRLRAALWEEEEKGRLGAHSVVLCADCHRLFLEGDLTRAEIARAYHKAKGYEPRGWIGRIDRDLLLDIVCLECGVILPVTLDDATAERPSDVRCPSCGRTNRFGRRREHWLTAELLA